ncbi:MAG: prepilin-type N-terminal cleavage/methylation domain-containing protein [Methylococcales bacterium]|nr:prepilin-type N-terminal cleavage/methylation domain-containing protein [Methylococcales bacterium]
MHKQTLKMQIMKGFTLVELLIVVIILAILAAIVVPQFSSTTDDAKASAADSTLANLRAAIDLYYQQHGEYPGSKTAVPSSACSGTSGAGVATGGAGTTAAAAFLEQLSLFTDKDGGACSISDTSNHTFGPYMKKAVLPADPFSTNVSTLTVVAVGDLNMVATADPGPGGWLYDSKTGKFIINLRAEETR